MPKLLLGLALLAGGGVLATIGGYLAKDAWDQMKAQPAGDVRVGGDVASVVEPTQLFTLVEDHLRRRDKYRDQPTTTASVLEYIDSVAREAKALADVWTEIADDLERGTDGRAALSLDDLEQKYGFRNEPNAPAFYRLRQFYRFLPKVAEGSVDPEWIQPLVAATDAMLSERPRMLAKFSGFSADATAAAFFSRKNVVEDLRTLRSSADLLQREAAAIQALSIAVRTSVGTRSAHIPPVQDEHKVSITQK